MHSARVSVAEAQTRVDYMSSCILLGRASQLLVTGRDLWEGLQLAGQQEQTEEANIQVYIISIFTRFYTLCTGVGRVVVGAGAAGHPQNNHKIFDEHCAEDSGLSSAAEEEE